MTKEKLVKSFRAGNMKASVWENSKGEGKEKKTWYSVSLQRSYKDKEGEWKNTESMNITDLPKANLVLSDAYAWSFEKSEED